MIAIPRGASSPHLQDYGEAYTYISNIHENFINEEKRHKTFYKVRSNGFNLFHLKCSSEFAKIVEHYVYC